MSDNLFLLDMKDRQMRELYTDDGVKNFLTWKSDGSERWEDCDRSWGKSMRGQAAKRCQPATWGPEVIEALQPDTCNSFWDVYSNAIALVDRDFEENLSERYYLHSGRPHPELLKHYSDHRYTGINQVFNQLSKLTHSEANFVWAPPGFQSRGMADMFDVALYGALNGRFKRVFQGLDPKEWIEVNHLDVYMRDGEVVPLFDRDIGLEEIWDIYANGDHWIGKKRARRACLPRGIRQTESFVHNACSAITARAERLSERVA